MTRAAKGCAGIAAGVILLVGGIYGWLGEVSFLLAGLGLVVSLIAAGALLSTQSRGDVRTPQLAVCALVGLAVALHGYANLRMISADFSYGWLMWAILPYALALTLACFKGTRVAAIAGAALALIVDAWTYYEVARSTSSTAAIAFIWMPLWDMIIVIPTATFLAWLGLHKRVSERSNAP